MRQALQEFNCSSCQYLTKATDPDNLYIVSFISKAPSLFMFHSVVTIQMADHRILHGIIA